jgi:hypothetical protein
LFSCSCHENRERLSIICCDYSSRGCGSNWEDVFTSSQIFTDYSVHVFYSIIVTCCYCFNFQFGIPTYCITAAPTWRPTREVYISGIALNESWLLYLDVNWKSCWSTSESSQKLWLSALEEASDEPRFVHKFACYGQTDQGVSNSSKAQFKTILVKTFWSRPCSYEGQDLFIKWSWHCKLDYL